MGRGSSESIPSKWVEYWALDLDRCEPLIESFVRELCADGQHWARLSIAGLPVCRANAT